MIDKRKREIGWMRCQIIFIIFIIMCSAYMIIYDECNRSYNAISITDIGSIALLHDENEIEIYREKGRPIIYYTHDGCQFVTVYDDKHELVSIIMLNDVEPFYDAIHTSYDWYNIFSNNDKGIVDLQPDGYNITLHYQWVSFDNGTKYLVVYANDNEIEMLVRGFTVVNYISFLLSSLLLVMTLYWQYYNITLRYNTVNAELHKIISNELS